jgi:hypothetical protein
LPTLTLGVLSNRTTGPQPVNNQRHRIRCTVVRYGSVRYADGTVLGDHVRSHTVSAFWVLIRPPFPCKLAPVSCQMPCRYNHMYACRLQGDAVGGHSLASSMGLGRARPAAVRCCPLLFVENQGHGSQCRAIPSGSSCSHCSSQFSFRSQPHRCCASYQGKKLQRLRRCQRVARVWWTALVLPNAECI